MNLKHTLLTVSAAAGLFGFSTIAANADSVTVKPGDTVSGIAQAHKTTIDAIKAANSMSNINLIYPGQTLEVNGSNGQNQAQTAAPVKQAAQPVRAAQPAQPAAAHYVAQKTHVKAPVQKAQAPAPAKKAPVQNTNTVTGSDAAAKNYIGGLESGNSYSARNGRFVGRYQLDSSYLGGDYSNANQDRVADQYVNGRYGSWTNAASFWKQHGWY